MMVSRAFACLALASAMAGSGVAAAAERAQAQVVCAPTGKKLVYECEIMLMGRKSGARSRARSSSSAPTCRRCRWRITSGP